MAKTTFQGILRSHGGDNTKTAYAGSAVLAATFHIPKSAADTSSVILPAGAIVTGLQVTAAATGGTNPTFDLGWIGVSDATALDVDGLVAEGDADVGASVFNYATATAGNDLGVPMSTTQMVQITGGVGASAATGGTITGIITYHVQDDGAQSV
jgi:hypothetical protein